MSWKNKCFGLALWGLLFIFCGQFAASASGDYHFDHIKATYQLHDDKLYDYVLRELDQFSRLYPDYPNMAEIYLLMGRVQEEDNKVHQALASYLKSLMLFPDDPSARTAADNVLRIIVDEDRYKDHIEYIRNKVQGRSDEGKADNAFAYVQLLDSIRNSKLNERCLDEYYNYLVHYNHDNRAEDVQIWLGDTYADIGQPKAAVAAYQKFEKLFPVSFKLPTVRYRRAVLINDELDDPNKAAEILESIYEEFPESKSSAFALFKRGEIYNDQKEYDKAVKSFNQLAENYPDNDLAIDALFKAADIQFKRLRAWQTTVDTYEKIVQWFPKNPKSAAAMEEMGGIYLSKFKDYDKAAETYSRFAEQYPANEKASELLFKAADLAEGQLGDFSRAVKYYRQVIDQYPDSEDSRKAMRKIESIEERTGQTFNPEERDSN